MFGPLYRNGLPESSNELPERVTNSDRWSTDWESCWPKTTTIKSAIMAKTITKRLQRLVIGGLLAGSSVVIARPTMDGRDKGVCRSLREAVPPSPVARPPPRTVLAWELVVNCER